MQCADIFALEIDITQLGLDQRHANMLAREVGPALGLWKPVAVHHHLLMGLQKVERMGYDADTAIDAEISMKQSKSRPESCIFIHDSPEEIKRKIKSAWCPESQINENPLIEIAKYIILREKDAILEIKRPEKYGGTISVTLSELVDQFQNRQIHPSDLKSAIADKLIEILEPARKYFNAHPEDLDFFTQAKITR
jgi:tyrosyl-tRNA synthetase